MFWSKKLSIEEVRQQEIEAEQKKIAEAQQIKPPEPPKEEVKPVKKVSPNFKGDGTRFLICKTLLKKQIAPLKMGEDAYTKLDEDFKLQLNKISDRCRFNGRKLILKGDI